MDNEYGVLELLTKGREMIDQYELELGLKFYTKAQEMEPENTAIMDDRAEVMLQLGLLEDAYDVLHKSITLSPDSNASKYLNMSQVVEGSEAERYGLLGITRLLKEDLTSETIRKQICDAYCSLGELYVTDLCFDESAEEKCEEYLEKAMSYDVGSPEPTQAYANLRFVQKRNEEAKNYMMQSFDRIKKLEDAETLPAIEFRIASGKLLMETELFEQAAHVLEGVLLEDDENAEVFFLVGKCYVDVGDFKTALEFLNKCEELLLQLQDEMGKEFHLSDPLLEVQQLRESLFEPSN